MLAILHLDLAIPVGCEYLGHVSEEAGCLDHPVVEDGGRVLPAHPAAVQPLQIEVLRTLGGDGLGGLVHGGFLGFSEIV